MLGAFVWVNMWSSGRDTEHHGNRLFCCSLFVPCMSCRILTFCSRNAQDQERKAGGQNSSLALCTSTVYRGCGAPRVQHVPTVFLIVMRCSARWSKKRKTLYRPLRPYKPHVAKRHTATTATTVLALCVSDATGPPIPSREAPDRRKHRPPATHTPQEVNLAIALARHTRRSAANHCTAARASTKCSCP